MPESRRELPVTVFDLLFVALFFAAIGALVAAGLAALRGRRTRALSILRAAGLSGAVYLGLVALVSLATPQRFVAVGDDQCSDDWCIAVTGVQRGPTDRAGTAYQVTFRLSSRARRVSQRERNVVAYLRDARGRRFDPEPNRNAVPFDAELGPQEAVTTTRAFVVPADATDVGLVVARTGFPFPACCIIGDEGSLFHQKTIVRLE